MIKWAAGFIVLSLIFCIPGVFALPISSSELINNAKAYDGRLVAYEGEVIGEVMGRGSFSWINLSDGQNAIGCWVDNALVKDIIYAGSYRTRGDLLEVVGTFNRSCPGHGGDLDIHVQALRKIKSGRSVWEKINRGKIEFVWALFFILVVIWILKRLKIK